MRRCFPCGDPMTYCVGLYLNDGIVLLADSRTNAGVDSISTFGKLHVWEQPGDRALALCTAGNLALSQAVVPLLREGFTAEDGKGHDRMQAATMFEEAGSVGSGSGSGWWRGRRWRKG